MSPMLDLYEGLIKTTHFDDEMRQLADRHYSRRTVGARQFLYSGRKLVLRDSAGLVLFAWIWPDAAMRMDGQVGYNNAIFRNESSRLSSDIVLEAEAAAFERWGPNRLYTYVAPDKILSSNPGYCFKVAGWKYVRLSKSGQHLLSKHDELANTEPAAGVTEPDVEPKPLRQPGRHRSSATETTDKEERAQRVTEAVARHGGDRAAAAAELGMRPNAVAMVLKFADSRAGAPA